MWFRGLGFRVWGLGFSVDVFVFVSLKCLRATRAAAGGDVKKSAGQ